MFAVLAAAAAAAAAAPGSKPTNFVVLFMDDNGWGDSSVNVGAADAVYETPHMQKMADEGITFSDFHSSFSVCTAARAALLTGRLAPRTGVANNFGPDSSFGMALGEETIADVLSKKGYDSHMIGKYRIGEISLPTRVRSRNPRTVANEFAIPRTA